MFEALSQSLEILVLGWGGVFLVMFVIYLVSMALARFCPPEEG